MPKRLLSAKQFIVENLLKFPTTPAFCDHSPIKSRFDGKIYIGDVIASWKATLSKRRNAMTIEAPQLLSKFRVSDDDLDSDPAVRAAYHEYCGKRSNFANARRELNKSTAKLHQLLDAPFRSEGLIPQGKEWTLKEDDEDGLVVFVWDKSRSRGRQRADVPLKRVSITVVKSGNGTLEGASNAGVLSKGKVLGDLLKQK